MKEYGIKLFYKVADTRRIPYIDRIVKAHEGLGTMTVLQSGLLEILTTRGNEADMKAVMRELEERVPIEFLGQEDEGSYQIEHP